MDILTVLDEFKDLLVSERQRFIERLGGADDPRVREGPSCIDDALAKLEQKDRRKADLVKLRYFAGLTMDEAAEALGISVATAHRHWNYARAWLHQEISDETGVSEKS